MNAQDKAKELVSKYYNYVSAWTVTNLPNEAPEAIYEGKKMKIGRAKQCALMEVNALIEQNGELYLFKSCENTMNYYRQKNAELFEVKTEIEKI